MAWTKNLGRVKGDTGDVYIPSVKLDENGYLHFTWESNDTGEIIEDKKIPIPAYIPTSYDDDGYIHFIATSPVINPTTNTQVQSEFKYYIKGDTGDPGPVHFDVQYVQTADPTMVNNPQTNTFYISNKKVWIYRSNNPNDYTYMEQFDFENYYTKNETYNMDQINDMLQSIENQVELTQQLYDIDEMLND